MQDQDILKTFNHRKHMYNECIGALRIYISFHASLKNLIYVLKLHFYQMNLKQNISKLTYNFT